MDEQKKCCPLTTGGNTTITNGDEAPVIVATTQGLTTRSEGMQEPGKH